MRITRISAVVATAVLAATAAFSGTANATHAWGSYHWARQSNPFTLKVGDNVTSAWDSYLNTSNSQWSQSTVLNLTGDRQHHREAVQGHARPRRGLQLGLRAERLARAGQHLDLGQLTSPRAR